MKTFFDLLKYNLKVPTLKTMAQNANQKTISLVIRNKIIRDIAFKIIRKRIRKFFNDRPGMTDSICDEQFRTANSILNSLDRLAENIKDKEIIRNSLVKRVIPAISRLVATKSSLISEHKKMIGVCPPAFLTISPTGYCNLDCEGCYANSNDKINKSLDYDVLDRIITEKKKLWASWLTVISGGEPFVYKNKGKTILDLAEKHPDNYFLVYTNGTCIDDSTAKKIAELGNITPGISVEGFEKETDARRGKGVYKKILKSFDNLKKYGVPYGISLTAFSTNCDIINQELFDKYFYEYGVYYIWIFQYMPIGRKKTLDLLVTPEQRLELYRKTKNAIHEKEMYVGDFWNGAIASCGCISAGASNGYLYIDWHGNVTPCAFNPYSPVNINDAFNQGKNLNDVLNNDFFRDIRNWQNDYALEKPAKEKGNWLRPCPIKDHYDIMLDKLKTHGPKPIDVSGQEALEDEEYQRGLIDYGKKVGEITDPIWKKEKLNIKE